VKIHSWLILQKDANVKKYPVVIVFHGNAGNIGHRMDYAKKFISRVPANLLFYGYRGYSKSGGEPIQSKWELDSM